MKASNNYLFFLCICAFIIQSSCHDESNHFSQSTNGIWESIGSGWILEIKDSTEYTLYDINSVACLPGRSAPYSEIASSIIFKSDTLVLIEGQTNYLFKRIKKLPSPCTIKYDTAQSNHPLFNFEYFAETVKEHYAFLELNKINWEELYNQQKSKLNQNSTDAELFLVIEETLEILNDNHAFLEATNEVYDSIDVLFPLEEDDSNGLPEYGDMVVAKAVADHHLETQMTDDSWLIQWGKMTDEIGFILIKAMWLYGDFDPPQSLIDSLGFVDAYIEMKDNMYEGDYIKAEVEAVRAVMDKVLKDLGTSNSIVIDVRFNGGGQDAVSCEILRSFLNNKTQIWQQIFRYGTQFSPIEKLILEGSEQAFTKPVYVLTSPKTGSAAECFSLATMSINHIKRIGDRTEGAMSTTLDKTLPNSWVFSISNQILMDNEGNAYENIGVPVDYKIDYPEDIQSFFRSVYNDLEKDKRDILAAINAIESGK